MFNSLAWILLARAAALDVVFRNEHDRPIEIFWRRPVDSTHVSIGVVPSHGGEMLQSTHSGHGFTYKFDPEDREWQMTIIADRTEFIVLSRPEIAVRCELAPGDGQFEAGEVLDVLVKPRWSPRGASRFLELVRAGYYDGVVINRVVAHFLAQFGISADLDMRTAWRSKSIDDDVPDKRVDFKPGYMSYAGSGPNSRSTEIFVVMPDTPESQLAYFGKNPWETPFGVITEHSLATVVPKFLNPYGDMPPWGNGPDPHQIYAPGGYEKYLTGFPKLASFGKCSVLERDPHPSLETPEL